MALISYVSPACILCGKSTTMELDSEDIYKWRGGSLIQDIWPDMPKEQREVIMSGTHPECWSEIVRTAEQMLNSDTEG
jgi:hypothetical protein